MPISPSNRASTNGKSLFPEIPLSRSWLDQVDWGKDISEELRAAIQESDFAALTKHLRESWQPHKKQKQILKRLHEVLRAGVTCPAETQRGWHALLTKATGSEESCEIGEELKGLLFANEALDLGVMANAAASLYLIRLSTEQFDDESLIELFRQSALREVHEKSLPAEFRDLQQLQEFVELPILTGYVLQDLKRASKLIRQGRKAARIWLKREVDAQGHPHARWVPVLAEIMQMLARVTLIAELSGEALWDKQDQERLRELIASVLALASPGRLAFSHQENAIESLYKAVRGLQVFAKKDPPAALLKSWSETKMSEQDGAGKKLRTWSLPDESWQSDDSDWAVMRTDWNSPASCCRLLYESPTPQLDIVLHDQPVISGPWSAGWRIDGQSLPLLDRWKCECWFNDEDMDYIELTQTLSEEQQEAHPARELWAGV